MLTVALIVTGKEISCVEFSDEQAIAALPVPRNVAMEIIEAFRSMEEFGCKFDSYIMNALAGNLEPSSQTTAERMSNRVNNISAGNRARGRNMLEPQTGPPYSDSWVIEVLLWINHIARILCG
jgi:hypothetical protein